MNEFPNEEVLVARGKYSTLGAERRALLKALREDVEAVTNHSRLAMRAAEEFKDIDDAIEESQKARSRIDQAMQRLGLLSLLCNHMEKLRPLAWGATKGVFE